MEELDFDNDNINFEEETYNTDNNDSILYANNFKRLYPIEKTERQISQRED